MSDDPKDKSDITRIEDLGEFTHDEEEEDLDFSELPEEVEEDLETDFAESFEEDFEEAEEFDLDQEDLFEDKEQEQEEQIEETFAFNEEDDFPSFESFEEPSEEEEEEQKADDLDQADPDTPELFPEIKTQMESEPEPEPELPTPPIQEITQITSSLNAQSFGSMPSPGNPPFSLQMNNIRYQEDIPEIVDVLEGLGLINKDNKDQYLLALQKGKLLVPRMSEYVAIKLANQLRRFHADIIMGLSEEVHSSDLYQETARGLISKETLNMNYEMNGPQKSVAQDIDGVMVSTQESPYGYQIERHIGVATESTLLDMTELAKDMNELKETFEILTETKERNSPLSSIYQKLSSKIKTQALSQYGNGVVNLRYEITPIVSNVDPTIHYYQVVCLGDIVVLRGK